MENVVSEVCARDAHGCCPNVAFPPSGLAGGLPIRQTGRVVSGELPLGRGQRSFTPLTCYRRLSATSAQMSNESMAKLRQRRPDQPTLFETENNSAPIAIADRTSTFLDNLSLPVHRWFRYSAGFSADWARQVIDHERLAGRTCVLDPFVGSGTVVLEDTSDLFD